MADIFKTFDKIYCINLPSRIDRWQDCLLQFEKYSIKDNLEKFDAVVYKDPILNRKQNAHLGCLFSHYSVLKKAFEQNYKNILILEDDFIFNFPKDETVNYLNHCFDELPIHWDLLYLGAYFIKGYDYEAKINYSDHLYKANTAFTTHSICYSRTGIKKMIACMKKAFLLGPNLSYNYESIDWLFVKEFLYENNCYASKEFLCGQKEGFSDIEGRVVDYKDYFLKGYNS